MDPPPSSSSSSPSQPFTSRHPPQSSPAPPQFGGFLSMDHEDDDDMMITHAGSFDVLHMPPPPPGSQFQRYLYSPPKPLHAEEEKMCHGTGTSTAGHATNLLPSCCGGGEPTRLLSSTSRTTSTHQRRRRHGGLAAPSAGEEEKMAIAAGDGTSKPTLVVDPMLEEMDGPPAWFVPMMMDPPDDMDCPGSSSSALAVEPPRMGGAPHKMDCPGSRTALAVDPLRMGGAAHEIDCPGSRALAVDPPRMGGAHEMDDCPAAGRRALSVDPSSLGGAHHMHMDCPAASSRALAVDPRMGGAAAHHMDCPGSSRALSVDPPRLGAAAHDDMDCPGSSRALAVEPPRMGGAHEMDCSGSSGALGAAHDMDCPAGSRALAVDRRMLLGSDFPGRRGISLSPITPGNLQTLHPQPQLYASSSASSSSSSSSTTPPPHHCFFTTTPETTSPSSIPFTAPSAATSSLQQPTPFLSKTFELVDDPSTNHVVSWNSDGTSMIIWNPQHFCQHLLPRYFKHNNLSSFVRQLNTYGFRKVDPERWEFANDGFRKGQPHLLRGIHRRKPSQQQGDMPLRLQQHHHLQRQEEQWRMLCRPSSSTVIEVGNFGLQEEIEQLRRDKNVLLMEAIRLRQHLDASERELQDMWLRLQSTERQQLHMLTFLARIMNNLNPLSLTHHLLRQQQHMYLNLPISGLHHIQSAQQQSQLLQWPNTGSASTAAAHDSDPPDPSSAPDPIPIEVQHDEAPIPLLCGSPSAVTGPSASQQCQAAAAAADEGISSSSSSSSSACRWPWMAGYNRVPEFGSSSFFTEPSRVACTEQVMCSTTADPENPMRRLSSAEAAAALPSVSSALGMTGGEQEQTVIRNTGIEGGRSLIGRPLTGALLVQQQMITDDPPAQAQEDENGAFWDLLLGDGRRQQQP